MPDLACFVVLALLVPLLPETLAALAERVPVLCTTPLRVAFDDGGFV
jgi:hypothetical protein